MSIQRVRGTEDILDLSLYNCALSTINAHLTSHNFTEIQTPIIENSALFLRSLGQETDVVSKEMYFLSTKTHSEESLCLRPEATASTMRAFLESGPHNLPWKVFSTGPMFRHERPQKGRWRQFTQSNIEIIGSNSIASDAHFISMLDTLFSKAFAYEHYVLKLNFLGTREDRARHKEKLYAFLVAHEKTICETCLVRKEKNSIRIFDCKNETCKKIYENAPTIIGSLSAQSKTEWEELCEFLRVLSVNFAVDHTLVRGLDYYNKTVFEFSSSQLGAQNAFCGGGRYDSLATEIGSSIDYPSIGAAIGIGRLCLLLESHKEKLTFALQKKHIIIVPLSKDEHTLALLLSQNLSTQNRAYSYEILFDEASPKNLLSKAAKRKADFAVIIGENERVSGTVSIKNMANGHQETVSQAKVGSYFSEPKL